MYVLLTSVSLHCAAVLYLGKMNTNMKNLRLESSLEDDK